MQTILRGPSTEVVISAETAIVMIGERINPTGRKVFSAELQNGDLSRIARDAKAQADAGALILDVNVGVAGVDEVALLPEAVRIVQDTVDLPVCIDSANPAALEAGLKVCKGRPLINSVNGEKDKLAAVLPLAVEYDAPLIALVMDDRGIPQTVVKRLEVAENILVAAQTYGIQAQDLLFDPLVMAVSADPRAGTVTVETARMIRETLGCNMTAGASNGSHGMPERELLNTVMLTLLGQVGVNAPICNPLKNGLAIRAINLMLGHDEWGMDYITAFRAIKNSV